MIGLPVKEIKFKPMRYTYFCDGKILLHGMITIICIECESHLIILFNMMIVCNLCYEKEKVFEVCNLHV